MRGATQVTVNPLRPRYNDRGLADGISKLSYSIIFVVNRFKFDDIWFKGHINNKQEIVYIKSWHRTGDTSFLLFLLNQRRCSSVRPIWPTGMDKLIPLQQLLGNYLKLNVNYVFALKDFPISATSFNDVLFLNLKTRCIYRQQHEQTCPIITIFLIVTKRHQTMSSPIVNILHHSYITNRKIFLRNICRWKDVVWKSRLAFSATIVQGHNT